VGEYVRVCTIAGRDLTEVCTHRIPSTVFYLFVCVCVVWAYMCECVLCWTTAAQKEKLSIIIHFRKWHDCDAHAIKLYIIGIHCTGWDERQLHDKAVIMYRYNVT
jgi:hypothetical protein